MSERLDLVSALLAADAAERERLLRSVDPETLDIALPQLTQRRTVEAAEVLVLIDRVVDDKGVRKAARRELHRLRSIGVHVPEAPTAAAPPAPHTDERVAVTEGWATDIDPSGSRAVWLVGERPLGGVWFAPMLLNDQRGLQDVNVIDTTHKRFLRELDDNGGTGTWVSLPGDYAWHLLGEAVEVTREVGGALPPRYRAVRDVFGEPPGAPERPLIAETISPVEVNFNPDWLEESPRLVGQAEVKGWNIVVPADFRPRVLEVLHSLGSSLVVPGHAPEQQAMHLLAEAGHQSLTPFARRALRRRLEETAYIFAQTDRLSEARLAAAAAHGLEDAAGGGSRVPPERHPFLRVLLTTGLARLVANEQINGQRASDVLIELVDRASQPTQPASSGPAARPSGLILPR